MADEPQAPEQQAGQEQPRFAPNGNGQKTGGPDGYGSAKYAPGKPEGQDNPGSDTEKPKASPQKKLIFAVIAAVVVIFGAIRGLKYWNYSHTHVGTDDAYVMGNLVNVSPIIGGTLSQLTVQEGDLVKQGQLIARLEDSGQRAALRQAEAAYQAAASQIPQARINLVYQQQATEAGIKKAQAELASQQARTQGAQQQVTLSRATVTNQVRQAESQVRQAQAQAASAQAQAAGAQANVRTAQAQVQAQRQAVQTAQRAAAAAAAQIAAAQANQTRASRDEARYATLVRQEAVTQQQYDVVHANAVSAASQLEAVRQQAQQAQSQVAQARAGVAQAQAQLRAAQRQADAAQRQADAARQQIEVARAAVGLAQANQTQVGISQTNVLSSQGQGGQAYADLANALAGRQQVALRQRQIETYQAQAAQSKAALANAKVTESDTYIYAPTSGQVVRKAVTVGASLSPGQTVVTMTAGDEVWVTANFKETQLTDVRPGQPAEVEVDSFPGKIFNGRVQAINQATGASTALLPPDNATGNFTKVVQRIPVRIHLVPASDKADKRYARAADIRSLRQGMSVTATIDTSNARH